MALMRNNSMGCALAGALASIAATISKLNRQEKNNEFSAIS